MIENLIEHRIIRAIKVKPLWALVWSAMYVVTAFADESAEMAKARQYGADACVVLNVVDQDGNAVSNANVCCHYSVFNKEGSNIDGYTDYNGMFRTEGKVSWQISWRINKDGYYETLGSDFPWLQNNGDCLKDGRWLPWGRIIDVTLKRKIDPIDGKGVFISYASIPKGISMGFDCLIGDFVSPYGAGKQADFTITYDSNFNFSKFDGTFRTLNNIVFTNTFSIGAEPRGGFVKCTLDTYSALRTPYIAPGDGFEAVRHSLRYPDKSSNDFCSKLKEQFMAFRCRVVTNSVGEIVSSHYGILNGLLFNEDIRNPGCANVSFGYSINPTPNDQNIEFRLGVHRDRKHLSAKPIKLRGHLGGEQEHKVK